MSNQNYAEQAADALGASIGSTISDGMPESRQRDWVDHAQEHLRENLEELPAGVASGRSVSRSKKTDRMKGRIDWFNDDKGFGFIEAPNMEGDAFFHVSEWKEDDRRPQNGDLVFFRPEEEEEGLAAKNVVPE